MSISSTAARTLSTSRSNGNSGVWTPTTTRPSAYASDQARTQARVRSQLMHVQVQKSTSTTFPRRPAGVSGSEFSQAVAPSKPARSPPLGSSSGALRNSFTPPPFPLPSPQRPEARSQLFGEQLRLFPRGEVTAPVHFV